MSERLDALAVKENNGKSYFTKLGVAFPNRDGKGYMLVLDAMPAPVDGQFKLMLREPLPRENRDQQSRGNQQSNQGRGGGGGNYRDSGYDDGSDVPFMTMDDPFSRRVL